MHRAAVRRTRARHRAAAVTGRATYGQLTAGASRSLAHARAMATQNQLPDERALADAAAAHADLVAALAHLGHTLHRPDQPQPRTPVGDSPARRAPRPRALLAQLDEAGQARDWEAPQPTTGCGLALSRAAQHARAAADLIATHHSPAGHARSPESTRLRHPAFLGAADREWRDLVGHTAELGTHLHTFGTQIGANPQMLTALRNAPRPQTTSRARQTTEVLDVSVARPAVRTNAGPLVELSDLIAVTRHTAWTLAQHQAAPAQVHRNLAAIGVLINDTAYRLNRRSAGTEPPSGQAARRADGCAAAGDAWRTASERTASLRTPTAGHTGNLERLRARDLLAQITNPRSDIDPGTAAADLATLAESFDQVAQWNAQALRAAHSRGEVLLAGRAIPNQLAADSLPLVAAKLADQPIPAPNHTIRALDRAYSLVGTSRQAAHDLVMPPPQL